MRRHGTLKRWNEARGFGFIEPAQGTHELFVHISAFPRGEQPVVGQMLSFTVVDGPDRRPRAVGVRTPASSARPARRAPQKRGASVKGIAAALVLVAAAGVSLHARFAAQAPWAAREEVLEQRVPSRSDAGSAPRQRPAAAVQRESVAVAAPRVESPAFACDGRIHCSQMTSCAEATFFLQHCPGVKMDGDRDGIPCEEQWCGGSRVFR
ncbi:cold shock domain-containing protein [Dokdonella sp. MW10]|uniref:cold shock domain-containing protein n=1 Tax=Dokdonella sp. MW10 TaxID=2992926 RepID=UPI003F7FA324